MALVSANNVVYVTSKRIISFAFHEYWTCFWINKCIKFFNFKIFFFTWFYYILFFLYNAPSRKTTCYSRRTEVKPRLWAEHEKIVFRLFFQRELQYWNLINTEQKGRCNRLVVFFNSVKSHGTRLYAILTRSAPTVGQRDVRVVNLTDSFREHPVCPIIIPEHGGRRQTAAVNCNGLVDDDNAKEDRDRCRRRRLLTSVE